MVRTRPFAHLSNLSGPNTLRMLEAAYSYGKSTTAYSRNGMGKSSPPNVHDPIVDNHVCFSPAKCKAYSAGDPEIVNTGVVDG